MRTSLLKLPWNALEPHIRSKLIFHDVGHSTLWDLRGEFCSDWRDGAACYVRGIGGAVTLEHESGETETIRRGDEWISLGTTTRTRWRVPAGSRALIWHIEDANLLDAIAAGVGGDFNGESLSVRVDARSIPTQQVIE